MVSVIDNGVGIDPDEQERVFEVFQRLHSRDEYAGTGIGLALCQRIVGRHGGEIWVDSEPERGRRSRLRSPLQRSPVSEPPVQSNSTCFYLKFAPSHTLFVFSTDSTMLFISDKALSGNKQLDFANFYLFPYSVPVEFSEQYRSSR